MVKLPALPSSLYRQRFVLMTDRCISQVALRVLRLLSPRTVPSRTCCSYFSTSPLEANIPLSSQSRLIFASHNSLSYCP
jgi:hypothetical protein